MYNVVESCQKGAYPLPSEKSVAPKISQNDSLSLLKRAMTLEFANKEESRALLRMASTAQDRDAQKDYFMQDLVCKAKIIDAFFAETGVERHDLDRAVKHYFQSDQDYAQRHNSVVR